MADRPSDRAIAQALQWANEELDRRGPGETIALAAAVALIWHKAREFDASASPPEPHTAPGWASNGATEVHINGRRYIPAPRAELNGSMGQQICEARENAGYSLSAAAKMLGISKAHLWEIEAGRQTNPTLQTMLALMQCYGLSAHVFLPPNT